MPLPLPPKEYQCTACGWQQRTLGGSDTLAPGIDVFDTCPECGCQHLQVRKLGRYPYQGTPLRLKQLQPTLAQRLWCALVSRR